MSAHSITGASAPAAADVYKLLGVRRVINAADTYTALGGGRLPAEVTSAMVDAAAHHVHVDELLPAVGRRIAELLDVPAALVVNGAAAGLTVAAAGCIAGTDPARVGHLPQCPGDRNQVVTLKCQRNPYDRALLTAGAELVEVGYADSTPEWSLESAIGPRTAAVVYYAGNQFEQYALPLERVAELAAAQSVPLVVDAAAQLPPVANLWDYLRRGADLVLFSGGKGLRGPQSSGLVVGRQDLVEACAANSYPHHSVARAMKTSKENILGLLAAVERAVALDWDVEYTRWQGLLQRYAAQLTAIPEVHAWEVPTGRLGQTCPRLFFEWTGPHTGTAGELGAALAARDPSILIGIERPRDRQAYLNPYSILRDEEDHLIDVVVEEVKVVVNS